VTIDNSSSHPFLVGVDLTSLYPRAHMLQQFVTAKDAVKDFLKKVHDCVDKGGKVLIPVFALGRAQELCILLETYWERMNLKVWNLKLTLTLSM